MNQRKVTRSNLFFYLGVAVLIIGAAMIYTVTYRFDMPGMKYLLMSPFLGAVACVMRYQLSHPNLFTRIGVLFAGIMVFVNVYMGVALFTSGIITDLIQRVIETKRTQAIVAGVTYPMACVFMAMLVAKYLVGGDFQMITTSWIILAGFISIVTGGIGTYLGLEFSDYLNKNLEEANS